MAQNTSEIIDQVTEVPEQQIDTDISTDTEISTEVTTEVTTEIISGTEYFMEVVPETEIVREVVYIQATEIDEQILVQSKVTNNLLGISIALQIFFLGLFFLVFFIKIIKNNVTNLY